MIDLPNDWPSDFEIVESEIFEMYYESPGLYIRTEVGSGIWTIETEDPEEDAILLEHPGEGIWFTEDLIMPGFTFRVSDFLSLKEFEQKERGL